MYAYSIFPGGFYGSLESCFPDRFLHRGAFNQFPGGFCGVLESWFSAQLLTNSLGDFLGFGIMISRPFSTQRTFQLIRFGDFMALWKSEFQTVSCAAELSTNSLGDFVSFWNDAFHTVSTQRSFQPIPRGILWGFGIMISKPCLWNYEQVASK